MIFKNFLSDARVWVYFASDFITEVVQNNISTDFISFSNQWESHNEKIQAELLFVDNNILLIGANSCVGGMCGRAIDAQVRFVEQLDLQYNLDFLNRNKIAYRKNNQLIVIPYSKLKEAINSKEIIDQTMVCNSLLQYNKDPIYEPISQSAFGELYFS